MRKIITSVLLFCMTLSAFADKVTVKTTQEFINALAPNRTIIIDSKAPFVITPVIDEMVAQGKLKMRDIYSRDYTPGVGYYSNTDGFGLIIVGFENLSIKSKEGTSTLLSKPRYCDVVTFFDCDQLSLENIVMGHTDEGYCDRGVLGLKDCDDVNIKDCDFFGCGTEGFVFENCSRVNVEKSAIHDCTYYIMHLSECDHVLFKDCHFHDNKEYEQINIYDSNDVIFQNCLFEKNQGQLLNLSSRTKFKACQFVRCMMTKKSRADMDTECVFKEVEGFPDGAFKDPMDVTGKWTDGQNSYEVTMPDRYTAIFVKTSDGDRFQLSCRDEDLGKWETGPAGDGSYPLKDRKYLNIFDAKLFSDQEYNLQEFVIFDDGHSVQDCYRKLNNPEDKWQDYLLPFYGYYVDNSGRKAKLDDNTIMLPDFEGTYSVLNADSPSQVIEVSPAKEYGKKLRRFYLKLTKEGMEIYEPIQAGNTFNPGSLLYRLNYDYQTSQTPRWSRIMADFILSHATFKFVPKDILPIMRNLPYAIQGYSFGKADLKNYFESQQWDSASSNKVIISRIEEFNCALIKFIERFEIDEH